MTTPITFTDETGVKWLLEAWPCCAVGERPVPQPYHRRATLSDLRAAAESQGYALVRLVGEVPTRDELRAIVDDVTAGSLLAGVEVVDPICRALFTAGSASRQAEVDRLTAERDGLARGQDDLNKCLAEAESELAAAKKKLAEVYGKLSDAEYSKGKTLAARYEWERRANAATAKLAEVERELDEAAKSAEYLAGRYNTVCGELERRVVEAVNAILEKGPRFTDRHLEAAADAVVDEIREAMALASATSSQPANVDASVIAIGESISEATKPATGDHDFSGQSDLASAKCRRCGVEPADCLHQPMPACVPANSMPDSVRETIASRFRAGDSVALLADDYDRPVEQIEEAIRSAIPDPAHACIMCDGTGQLNGMRLNSYSDLDAENVKLRERCARQRRELRRLNRSVVPTRLASRCNAPEPAASVPRSAVEAFRDEARLLRDDFKRQADGPPRDHNAWIRHRVWGYVHECLEELLAKGQVKP